MKPSSLIPPRRRSTASPWFRDCGERRKSEIREAHTDDIVRIAIECAFIRTHSTPRLVSAARVGPVRGGLRSTPIYGLLLTFRDVTDTADATS